ncbi:MAG: hypothetical protein J4431_00180 [Candidatus Aenigmarchaeota archaeon]|nr:hypothetical protein [Candidatus Aenigmarchaeota archaeon]
MQPDVLEKYKKFQTKFSLPHLTELKETFNFEIEEEGEIFEQIRTEISNRVFSFTERIIEPIIGDADSLSGFYEQHMITKEDKERLFGLYKRLQVLKWKNNMLLMDPEEEDVAQWIRETWQFWNDDMKKELKHVCKKLSAGWADLKFKSEPTNYHG